MMQHQIFIKIYLFKRNETNISKRYLICSNLLIKITQQCHWQNCGVVIINFLLCSPCILLFMLNNITITKTEIKAEHRTSHSNLWGILQELKISYLSKTSLNGYFKLTSDICPKQWHSKVKKSGGQTMGQNTGKLLSLHDFNSFKKKWE